MESTYDFSTIHRSIWAVAIITWSFVTALVSMRAVCRISQKQSSSVDYVVCIAWAVGMVYSGMVAKQNNLQFTNKPSTDVEFVLKFNFALDIVYCLVINLAKVALALQLITFFAPTKTCTVARLCYGFIVFHTLLYIGIVFSIAFACTPPSKAWNPQAPGFCAVNLIKVEVASGFFNILADFFLLAIPPFVISRLNLRSARKFGLAAIFMIGILGCVSSIVRTAYDVQLVRASSAEATYILGKGAIWTLIEVDAIFICICGPFIPQFCTITDRALHSTNSSRDSRGLKMQTYNNRSQTERARKLNRQTEDELLDRSRPWHELPNEHGHFTSVASAVPGHGNVPIGSINKAVTIDVIRA